MYLYISGFVGHWTPRAKTWFNVCIKCHGDTEFRYTRNDSIEKSVIKQ